MRVVLHLEGVLHSAKFESIEMRGIGSTRRIDSRSSKERTKRMVRHGVVVKFQLGGVDVACKNE